MSRSDNIPDVSSMRSSDLSGFQASSRRSESPSRKRVPADETKAQEIKRYVDSILSDPKKYYQLNNVILFPPFSPFFKTVTNKIEKKFEFVENMLRKWTKLIKEMIKNCVVYIKSVEVFANQLVVDKLYFNDNKELQILCGLLAQFLKEHDIYMEVFTKILDNSIYT